MLLKLLESSQRVAESRGLRPWQLLEAAGGFGEAVEAGGAARALEGVGQAGELVEVCRFAGRTHGVDAARHGVDKLGDDFANFGIVGRQRRVSIWRSVLRCSSMWH